MLQKIKDTFSRGVFGYTLIKSVELETLKKESEENLRARLDVGSNLANLRQKLEDSKLANTELREKLSAYQNSMRLGQEFSVLMEDPLPLDTVARRTYVAQVAGLYKDILEPKLKHMLSKSFLLLEDSTNDRDFDQAVKGAIYFCREFIRWGNLMVSEQVSNQQQGLSEEESVITKVKSL